MLRALVGPLVLATFAVAFPVPSAAQERPSRPYRGLFGGGLSDTEQHLTVAFGGVGGRDRVSSGRSDTSLIGVPTGSASFGSWTGQAEYGLSRSRFSLGAAASGYSRFAGGENSSVARNGSVTGQWQILRRTTIGGGATMTYEPLSVLSFFPTLPGAAVEPSTFANYTLDESPLTYLSDQTNLYLTHQLGRRSTFTASYNRQRVEQGEDTGPRAVQMGAATFNHRVGPSLSVRLGYYEARGGYGLEDETSQQVFFRQRAVNFGLDYNGSLALSRRTTLAVNTGSAVLSEGGTQRFHITGSALLRHEMGRTWDTTLSYERLAGFLHSFREPSFMDSLIASVNGLTARRVQLHSSVGVSVGSVGLRSKANYNAYHGGAGFSLAASRFVSFRLNYTYYRFNAAESQFLPLGLERLSRHGIVSGVDVFAPIFVRARRGNVAR